MNGCSLTHDIIRGLLALAVVIPIGVLAIIGSVIPDGLLGFAGLALGYFFGAGAVAARVRHNGGAP